MSVNVIIGNEEYQENDNRKTKTKKAGINGGTIASSQANYASILKSSVSRSLMKTRLDLYNTNDLKNATMEEKAIEWSVIEYTKSEHMIIPRSAAKRIKQNIAKEKETKGEGKRKTKHKKKHNRSDDKKLVITKHI